MAAFVVLLRGVNLGPNRRVPAADLRGAALDAGFATVRTLLNSGNVVLTTGTSGAERPDDVARLLTSHLAERVGTEIPAIALTADRLRTIAAANPFPAAARDDPSHLQVHVPFGTVDEAGIARLDLHHPGREHIGVAAGVVYVHYVDGIGRSKLTTATLDGAAGTRLTARNWNTITRLGEMLRDLS
ncbi:DUF1697 domain-containing protein [Myceligenerans xiligouense]|uniref:Uncharacterized protein (DUF1697 family) n=1 Tax=Myceligenerans xiligouense TaxID=253184 RepID=A0A3N4YNC7_9MICO|nr:DUF1697 domain-containing protein [Myceligenerans xiligouense]RPF22559.1 uncharacterized protein (DUF1697 family) [Myceligenerans xiligouense]